MVAWRDHILKEFAPQIARLTLVSDPDGLLLEEVILQQLREKGFELIPFEDHVAFRFAYESRYRASWDRGEATDLVVVLRSPAQGLRSLPYDLLEAGRQLSFQLAELFPNLSYPVVAALDRSDLDALYEAQTQYKPDPLGDRATRDFVLRHVFDIVPESIKEPTDLLRVLLRRHYSNRLVPALLDERFIQVLRQQEQFQDWPLEAIVPHREEFFAFLQERWPIYLDHLAQSQGHELLDSKAQYEVNYPGPADISFDHDDIRVYLDNLFLDGLLQPARRVGASSFAGQWVAIGLEADGEADRLRRLDRLSAAIVDSVPSAEAKYQEWLAFAPRWAEMLVLWHGASPSARSAREASFLQAQCKVDAAFLEWVFNRYPGLYTLPPAPPVMLHHVPRAMARWMEEAQPPKKAALVVFDGMALDQWIIVRQALGSQMPSLTIVDTAVFAWVPTITPVSRQAIFAGKPPIYYPGSIHTNDREGKLWSQFWLDEGLSQPEVVYLRGLREEPDLGPLAETLSHPKVRVAGLVVDKVDKITHGMELGTAGMHNQVYQWATTSFVPHLLELLFAHSFNVFITSDHGNIEAMGIGKPTEGAVADLRGQRARVYPNEMLRTEVKGKFPQAMEWPPIGLPDDFLPLLAPDRCAFSQQGQRIVSHGGISIEELIVPFVRLERKAQ